MIKRAKFTLNDRAILRQEDDVFYLFHPDNGAILKFRKHPEELIATDEETAATVRKTLAEHGFIKLAGTPQDTTSWAEQPRFAFDINSVYGTLRSENGPFQILWGIAGHCNLKCIYCFPDIPNVGHTTTEMSTRDALAIAKKMVDAAVLEVTLSGGETLLRKDIFEIARYLREHSVRVSMITNGLLVDDKVAATLKELNINVGLSLDAADENINKITRGEGVVEAVDKAATTLIKGGVTVGLICTVSRHNFDHIDGVFEFAKKHGIRGISMQDLRIFGTKEYYDKTRLTWEQEDQVPAKIEHLKKSFPGIAIATLEMLMYKHTHLVCPAGGFGGYVDPAGDFFPCTSLPKHNMGSLITGDLVDLWQNSECINRVRANKKIKFASCDGCDQWETCLGGCRGDALFYSGKVEGIPSRCPRNRPEKKGAG